MTQNKHVNNSCGLKHLDFSFLFRRYLCNFHIEIEFNIASCKLVVFCIIQGLINVVFCCIFFKKNIEQRTS